VTDRPYVCNTLDYYFTGDPTNQDLGLLPFCFQSTFQNE
jgi:hypothetical protein